MPSPPGGGPSQEPDHAEPIQSVDRPTAASPVPKPAERLVDRVVVDAEVAGDRRHADAAIAHRGGLGRYALVTGVVGTSRSSTSRGNAARVRNLSERVHNHAPPSGTPHIKVCVEHTDYRPLRLEKLVGLAKRLVAGKVPRGATTGDRIRNIERAVVQRSKAEGNGCSRTDAATA